MTEKEREILAEWMSIVNAWLLALTPVRPKTPEMKEAYKSLNNLTTQFHDPRTPGIRTTGRPIDDREG